MNEEIKENIKPTLEWLKECANYNWIFETSNSSELLDYITNLQQENEDYKSRCEKANEYIKKNTHEYKMFNNELGCFSNLTNISIVTKEQFSQMEYKVGDEE